jgi:hypothetical protein
VNTEATVISAVCKNKDISTLLADNVDDLFTSHRDVWDGLKSYYYKFKAVPEVGVLQEKFKDFDPDINVKAETGYYLDKLKNEYLSSRLKSIMLQGGAALKEDAASRVLSDMQSKLSTFTINDVFHQFAICSQPPVRGWAMGFIEAVDAIAPERLSP